jgi:threonine/homoserine/homoserine lactone efflux protein
VPNLAELFIFGLTAGIALAIPVGPMALLLIDTTLRHGLRVGAAGALAMASVDATYAVVVFLAGSAVAGILGAFGIWFSLFGAAILLGLGAQTILKALSQRRASAGSSQFQIESTTARKTFVKFAAATVVNPPTALYFLAITPSLVGLTGSDPVSATFAFATGVFIGSVIWQQALAIAGAAIRGVTTPKVRTWLSLTGGVMIIALAVVLAIRTFS